MSGRSGRYGDRSRWRVQWASTGSFISMTMSCYIWTRRLEGSWWVCLAAPTPSHTRTLLRVHGLSLRGANRAPAELHLAHPCIRVPCTASPSRLVPAVLDPILQEGLAPSITCLVLLNVESVPRRLLRRMRLRGRQRLRPTSHGRLHRQERRPPGVPPYAGWRGRFSGPIRGPNNFSLRVHFESGTYEIWRNKVRRRLLMLWPPNPLRP